MGKKGKKSRAGKLTRKDLNKRLDILVDKVKKELEGADLFAPLPATEDCSICFLPLSRAPHMSKYQVCCGKRVCKGCSEEHKEILLKAWLEKNAGKKIDPKAIPPQTCPFCREPPVLSTDEQIRRLGMRMLQNDPMAILQIGLVAFYRGELGVSKNELKAIEHFILAAELGSADACSALVDCLRVGSALSDCGRSVIFLKAGAFRGCITSRWNIGILEYETGNCEEGIRHFKIAAEAGCQAALDKLKKIFLANGQEPGKEFITKTYLDKTLRICHAAQKEVESEERKKHCDLDDYDKYRC